MTQNDLFEFLAPIAGERYASQNDLDDALVVRYNELLESGRLLAPYWYYRRWCQEANAFRQDGDTFYATLKA